jgi:hypothetical protein
MSDGCEATARQNVFMLSKERLLRRITAAKREEANAGGVEIDLSANEPLSPARIDQEGPSEN